MGTVVADLVAKLSVDDQMTSGLQQAGAGISQFGRQTDTHLKQAGGTLMGIGAAGLGLFGSAVKVAADFDQQLADINATGGPAVEGRLDEIRETAMQLGADTAFSATEAAAGMNELLKAGVSVDEVLDGGAKTALDFAAATGESVPFAAGQMATAMTLFGDQMAEGNYQGEKFTSTLEQGTHVADLFAAAANTTRADAYGLGQSLEQVGLVAVGANQDIDTTIGTLAAFADAGLAGSDAGTSLKTALLRLSAPTDTVRGLMDQYGIEVRNADGSMKSLVDIAGELDETLSGLDSETADRLMKQIFGDDAIRAGRILADLGKEGLQGYVDGVNDAGAASEAAAKRMDSFYGNLDKLKGSLEGIMINFGNGLLAGLNPLVGGLTTLANVFGSLPAPVQAAIGAIGGVASVALVAGGAVLFMAGQMMSGVQAFQALRAAGGIRTVLQGAAQSMGLMGASTGKATGAVGKATGVLGKLGGVLGRVIPFAGRLNPVMLGLTAVMAAGALAVTAYQKNWLGFGDAVRKVGGWVRSGASAVGRAAKSIGSAILNEVVASGEHMLEWGKDLTEPLWSPIVDAAKSALGFISDEATNFADNFKNGYQAAIDGGASPFEAALHGMANALDGFMGLDTPGFVENLADGFRAAEAVVGTFTDTLSSSYDARVEGGMSRMGAGIMAVGDAIESVFGPNVVSDTIGQFGGFVDDAAKRTSTFTDTLQRGLSQGQGVIGSFFQAARAAFPEFSQQLIGVQADVTRFVQGFQEGWDTATDAVGDAVGAVGDFLQDDLMPVLEGAAGQVADWAGGAMSAAWDGLQAGADAAFGALQSAAETGLRGLQSAWDGISSAASTAWNAVSDLDWGGIWSGIQDGASGAWDFITGAFERGREAISNVWGTLSEIEWGDIFAGLQSLGSGVWDGIVEAFNRGREAISNVWNTLSEMEWGDVFAGLQSLGSGVWDGIVEAFNLGREAISNVYSTLTEMEWGAVFSGLSGLGDRTFGTVMDVANQMKDAIVTVWETLSDLEWGDIFAGIGDAVQPLLDALGDVKEAAGGAFGWLGDKAGDLNDWRSRNDDEGEDSGAVDPMADKAAERAAAEGTDFGTAYVTMMAESLGDADWTPVGTALQDGIASTMQVAPYAGGDPAAPRAEGIGLGIATALAASVAQGISAAPVEVFSSAGAALMNKMGAGVRAAMAGQFGTGGRAQAPEGGFAAQMVTGIANSLAEGIGQVGPEAFASAGSALMTALGTSIQTSMSAMGGQMGGGGRNEGGVGAQAIVESLASGLAVGIGQVGPEAFASAGSALMNAIGRGVTAAMSGQFPGGGGLARAPEGGFASGIVTSIANGLATGIPQVGPEAFAMVGSALMTAIGTGVQTAMAGAGGQMGGGGRNPAGSGAAAMATTVVQSIATSLAEGITTGGAELFAPAGQAVMTQLSAAIDAAMAGGGGAPAQRGGGGRTVEIGSTIANSIAEGVTTADFSGVTEALRSQLTTAIETAFTEIQEAVSTAMNTLQSTIQTGFGVIASTVATSMVEIRTSVGVGFTEIETTVSTAMNTMQSTFQTGFGVITETVTTAMTEITTAVTTGFQGVQEAVSTSMNTIQSTFQTGFGVIVDTVVTGMADIVAAVDAGIAEMEAAAGRARAAGEAIGRGLAEGMSSQIGAVKAAAGELAAAATEAINLAAQVASPSKVTTYSGQMMGEGLIRGLLDMKDRAIAAATDIASSVMAAMDGSLGEMLADDLKSSGDALRGAARTSRGSDPAAGLVEAMTELRESLESNLGTLQATIVADAGELGQVVIGQATTQLSRSIAGMGRRGGRRM